jgi:clorobiocin biosynthesis protein CloN5
MPDDRTDDPTQEKIVAFIRERFLDGDPRSELAADSPLLEWGVLNSMNTTILLMFLRDELGVQVPHTRMNEPNLRNVKAIAAMVEDLAAEGRSDSTSAHGGSHSPVRPTAAGA